MSWILEDGLELNSDSDTSDDDFSDATSPFIGDSECAYPLSKYVIELNFLSSQASNNTNNRVNRLLLTPVIEVQVGTGDVKVFHIHQSLLAINSRFFKDILYERSLGNEEKVIRLSDDDPQTFAAFAQWIYTGESDIPGINSHVEGDRKGRVQKRGAKTPGLESDSNGKLPWSFSLSFKPQNEIFPQIHDGNDASKISQIFGKKRAEFTTIETDSSVTLSENMPGEDETFNFALLFSSYVFANKIQATSFKAHIVDGIAVASDTSEQVLDFDSIRYAYQNTSEENDPLRRFCVRMACRAHNLESNLNDPEFIRLCEDISPFGSNVLRRCGKRMKKIQAKKEELPSQRTQVDGGA